MCQWTRYQQMVLKNMKCSPKVLRALEFLRVCTPNGCCHSSVLSSSLRRRADAGLAIREAFCVILHKEKSPCGLGKGPSRSAEAGQQPAASACTEYEKLAVQGSLSWLPP